MVPNIVFFLFLAEYIYYIFYILLADVQLFFNGNAVNKPVLLLLLLLWEQPLTTTPAKSDKILKTQS